jgi:hypothetical protein
MNCVVKWQGPLENDVAAPALRSSGEVRQAFTGFSALEAAKLALAAEVLRSSGKLRLRAMGASMLPAIRPGDILTILRVGPDGVQPGEIALYSRDDRFFIHRAVENREGFLIARGDALPNNDPPVRVEELLGRVTAIERGSTHIPVRNGMTLAQRLLAGILRRSALCTRLMLGLNSRASLPEKPCGTERA